MDINADPFGTAILLILGVSGVVAIIDYAGFLPSWAARWIARNRLEASLRALQQIGVRVCWDEGHQSLTAVQRTLDAFGINEPAYKVRLGELLQHATFEGHFDVGTTRTFTGNKFIDVMGSSTDAAQCVEYARILKTHAEASAIAGYDFVATPKDGSPLLGYEFSRLQGKQLVLAGAVKARDPNGAMGEHAYLDFPRDFSPKGKKGLLVDDSTTGGRKLLSLAQNLIKAGSSVTDALVLFEPEGKGARALLEKSGVNLHSIVVGPAGKF